MANLLVPGSLRDGGQVLLDDFSHYFICMTSAMSRLSSIIYGRKKNNLKPHKERNMGQHPDLISQQGRSATQVCQFWESISRAMQYLSHTFGHEHMNEVFYFFLIFKKTHWSISWDGNSKFYKPALRHLFRKKSSTWKLSLAGKNKLSRQNPFRLPSFQGWHVNGGTANQPACREAAAFTSVISTQKCRSQL